MFGLWIWWRMWRSSMEKRGALDGDMQPSQKKGYVNLHVLIYIYTYGGWSICFHNGMAILILRGTKEFCHLSFAASSRIMVLRPCLVDMCWNYICNVNKQ